MSSNHLFNSSEIAILAGVIYMSNAASSGASEADEILVTLKQRTEGGRDQDAVLRLLSRTNAQYPVEVCGHFITRHPKAYSTDCVVECFRFAKYQLVITHLINS